MPNRYWKTSELASLRELLRVETPISEIARKLNRTPRSIYGARVAFLHHKAKPRVTEAEAQQARVLWAAGRTIEEIAEATGRYKTTVRRMLVGVRMHGDRHAR